jgi:hypothetical protein
MGRSALSGGVSALQKKVSLFQRGSSINDNTILYIRGDVGRRFFYGSTDHIKIGFISVSPGVHIMVPQAR